MRPCLIQVEYFHTQSLPLKICLRFHDTKRGTITGLALDIEGLNKKIDQTVGEMSRPDIGWLRQRLYRWKWRRLRFALKTHLKLLEYAVSRQIDRAVLAIEMVGRYRPLRDDEKPEILTWTKKYSRLFWVFVFTPNDLLAERNELVTAVM